MKTVTTVLVIGALSLAAASCGRATSPVSPTVTTSAAATAGAAPVTTTAVRALYFAFTKVPAGYAEHTITSSNDVELLAFQIDATKGKDASLTGLQFMVIGGMLDGSGGLPTGYLTNFRLVYYPKGLGTSGTIVATNDATGWIPGPAPANFLSMNVAPAFDFKQNFAGVFALLADVAGARARFQAHLQVATMTIGGVNQPLTDQTCDLPLAGDGFIVQ